MMMMEAPRNSSGCSSCCKERRRVAHEQKDANKEAANAGASGAFF